MSPVVVDLGCGLGVGLLSLVQPSPAVAGRAALGLGPPEAEGQALGLAPPPALTPPVNVLGCDACALKVGYASHSPRPSALTLALVA